MQLFYMDKSYPARRTDTIHLELQLLLQLLCYQNGSLEGNLPALLNISEHVGESCHPELSKHTPAFPSNLRNGFISVTAFPGRASCPAKDPLEKAACLLNI